MTGPDALTERFHRSLGRGDDYGAMVVDHRIDDVDARLRRFFDELLTDGTPYMRLDRLVDTVLLGPSHHPNTFEIDGAGLVEFPKPPQAKARGKGKLTEEV